MKAETPKHIVRENSDPSQRVIKIRRDYNTWVANETLEDYALRYTPRSFRKWSIFRVANTAFGAISFLVLEAIGGTIAINYGFVNALWAILAAGSIIFLTGFPIAKYAVKYGVDIDLLTRGAGFGYIGSTISSFVYASFTFILFALEAAIMAYALELYFALPLYLGYLFSALIVIPMVTHGVTLISRIQMLSQPIWILLMALPFFAVLHKDPNIITELFQFAGNSTHQSEFNLLLFGAATAVGIALIAQIGEQVDFLRFMPEKTNKNRWQWHFGVIFAGPGWILLGMLKMLAGALLAYVAVISGLSFELAVNPTHMYWVGFTEVFSNVELALAFTVLFVIISQLKVNITNAYAGSLAWSNFFARLTHSHPGRVVWAVFNALIAVMLMELDVFRALDQVLGLYSNIAVSWITAVAADLVINKPLGLSPKGIEFRRAYLYDINPVGVGAMLLASVLSVTAFFGAFGDQAQAFSAFIALITSFVASPIIAWLSRGKYYIARTQHTFPKSTPTATCTICEKEYEVEDLAQCPAYQGFICSLCCCLDARCNDVCKPHGRVAKQWELFISRVFPRKLRRYMHSGLGHYLLLMAFTTAFLGAVLGLIYVHESITLASEDGELVYQLRSAFLKIFATMLFASGIVVWWLVLTSKSRQVAQEESNRQYGLLKREMDLHRETDAALQLAKVVADQANQAKSRYVTGISHELRTPLNSILGYAQLLANDPTIPAPRQPAIRVIRKSGEHLLSLVEGTLDIARIESGKMTLNVTTINFPEFMNQIVNMFDLQAKEKGLDFRYQPINKLPRWVRADQKRLGQILINILGNAVKFTDVGHVTLRLQYAREIALIEIEDTGPGIVQSEIQQIFEPFARGSVASKSNVSGTGLGLTISKMLTDLMGGELNVRSTGGNGSTFQIRLFLPQAREDTVVAQTPGLIREGYRGRARKILVVDNEQIDRVLITNILQPLGFEIAEAESGVDCLKIYPTFQPDLILMDLAMPIMDGWQTINIIRNQHHSDVAIAIVSANAFDKVLDNTVGIRENDFILKPVNVNELLDWIGHRLRLDWITKTPDVPIAASPTDTDWVWPPQNYLDDLRHMTQLGYVRGIRDKLQEISVMDNRYTTFVYQMRKLTDAYQLDLMLKYLNKVESHAVH